MSKKMQNDRFIELRDALGEVIDSFEKGKKLTCREISLSKQPQKLRGKAIAHLREKKLNVSQPIFAAILNVSPKTVRAWEQDVNTPSGPALRLLWLLQKKPDIFKPILMTLSSQ